MPQFLLPLIYTLLLAFLVWKLPRLRGEGVPSWVWVVILVLKCVLGIAYIEIHRELFDGGDTGKYLRDGQIIFNTLTEDPLKYLRLTFGPNGTDINPWLAKEIDAMGFWGDTSAYTVVRFNAVANLLTWGNSWANGVFMAFLSYCGILLLYKAFKPLVSNHWWVLGGLLCVPSVWFWTSGIHKEALALFTLSWAVYGMARIYLEGWLPKFMLYVALGLLGTFFIRDFLVLLLLPLLLAQIFSPVFHYGRVWVYLSAITLILIVGIFVPIVNNHTVLELIVNKQDQFAALRSGHSNIPLAKMEPTLTGLATTLPHAIYNQFIAPFMLPPASHLYWPAIIDHAWFILLLAVGLCSIRKPLLEKPPLLTALFFGLMLIILIGLIVPNVGAILRYRSLAIPFILMPLLVGRKVV
ncbi:hypothetical protein BH09BAC1_BH09BAC1_14430 [soil metagenome]